jgi:integrase
MAAPLIKTKTPGIYKRGSRYVFSYRVNGVQRWESCRTLEEARRAKSARSTDIGRGEFEERSRVTLHAYLSGWIERYQGTGRRGFREETRNEYRGLLNKYALQYFPASLKLTELSPSGVAGFVAWLCDPAKQGRELADNTVRNALSPLRAALATARREGLIRHNPVSDVALPHRARIEDDEDHPRPFPNGVMELVVSLVHPTHRLMFDLLAATGLRRSELLGLEGQHLALDGDSPHVKIRQRVRRRVGAGLVVGPLKSRYSRRDVPIGLELADRLRALGRPADRPVFSSTVGTLLDPDNLAERVLAPACAEAGVEWAGFHTFRHTVASRLFASGRNAVQVQRWLGHHSAAFTLSTYVHLLDGDLGEPLAPQSLQPSVPGTDTGVNRVRTDLTPLDATPAVPLIAETP